MFSRSPRARQFSKSAENGKPQLILAKLMVFIEAVTRSFARPLTLVVVFAVLAWLGVFTQMYPWAHLIALILFILFFFEALGKAGLLWQKPSASLAKRRLEEASGLSHRPFDVLEDRPILVGGDTHTLWQTHAQRAREQLKTLHWPRWQLDFAKRDPYRLRYVLLAFLIAGLVSGWGALGGRLIAAINPALGKIPLVTATVDAWIAPPEYTHMPPIMIATPAGNRYQNEVIKVPEGSVLHAHLAEKDGDKPVLRANTSSIEFSAEDQKDFSVAETLTSGDTVAIRRSWMTLGSWHVQIVPDTAPQIAFTEAPSASERKDVRIAFEATDDFGVTSVSLRVTPRESMPGINPDPILLPLASADEKEMKRVVFKDLTAEPGAGMMVDLQLVASDAVGHTSESNTTAFTLPERVFFNPIARALITERKKLLQNALDTPTRNETANLMAGLASQPASFGKDPVVMMALRAGAVRLVLDHDSDSALAVKDILWQAATRIEDGAMGTAEQDLKHAQQDLTDALDRNASEKEVQALIDRLHQALVGYLAQLSSRVAPPASEAQDLGQLLGSRTNMLTPQDLQRMLDDMKSLSASGARDAARQTLSRMQQALENLQTQRPALNEQQRASLEALKALRALTRDQQALLDATFQKSHSNKGDAQKLAEAQAALRNRVHDLKNATGNTAELSQSAEAMDRAERNLRQGASAAAMPQQNEALKALQQAQKTITENLRASLFALPQGGGEGQQDPFGREGGNTVSEGNDTHVPDRFEAQRVREILDEIQRRAGDTARPKTELDYIERLLRNF